MSLLQHAPRFEPSAACTIARAAYGLEAEASPLDSERDQNFLLQVADGRRFVLKIANASEDRELLEAQNAAMAHAAGTGLCPAVLPSRDGTRITQVDGPSGARHFVRLLTWISGTPLGRLKHHSPALLNDLGRAVATIDAALATFDHPAIHRTFHWDLAAGLETIARHSSRIADPSLRAMVERTAADVSRDTAPLLPALRCAAIHNDANDYNVLVHRGPDLAWRIAGVIDFGDTVYSYAVADLAVAIAYAILGKPDPLAAAVAIVRGYNDRLRLTADEIAALFGLVRLRLAMSACVAAWQTEQRPADRYLAISQAPLERTLPKLIAIPPRFAEASFRHACRIDPLPVTTRVSAWLNSTASAPVLPGVDVAEGPGASGFSRTVILDLSVSSPHVSGNPDENLEPALTPRIVHAIEEAGASIAVGRYGEPRLLYPTPLFAGENDASERRTIHLGVDLFVDAGTQVAAAFAGRVHAVADHPAPLDHGPTVILEHRTDAGDPFYTLYAHLDRTAMTALTPGQAVRAGEPFAAIGDATVNGGWTPHLHFQLIVDLLGMDGAFPGMCRASERAIWKAFSPDPNPIFQIPAASFPDDPFESGTALKARHAWTGANLSVGYRDPLKVARGTMQYLYDQTGRRFIDGYNNVPHVGHSHPRVVRAVEEQLRVLNTNTRYLYDSLPRYAERLAATLPDPLSVCYFVNSGSEANELALRLARAYTGRRALVVLDSAYHGNTTTLIDISPYKFNGPGGQGAPPWVHVVPLPEVYRGEFREGGAGARYAEQVRQAIVGTLGDGPGRLCGFVAETCPSVAGQIVLPPGYLQGVYQHVRAAGGVCIADEVQTAYGRMGSHFYAFEAHGVIPDIVVLGKPIGNGYPLGAVITTRDIAASFDNGMEFFSTFGGSTVSCAAGLAVLEIVQEEQLQAHASKVGERLLAGLRALGDTHAVIGDVRGSGLFLGVDLVLDREMRTPARVHAAQVVNRMREEGVLIGTEGPHHNVLKIRPPMPFGDADADRLVETLDRVLGELDPLS